MNIQIDADELAKLREENKRLTDREEELLSRNTALRYELQAMRSISVVVRDIEEQLNLGLEKAVIQSKWAAEKEAARTE